MKKLVGAFLIIVSFGAAAEDQQKSLDNLSLIESLFGETQFECNTYPQCPPAVHNEEGLVLESEDRVFTFKKKKHD